MSSHCIKSIKNSFVSANKITYTTREKLHGT